MPSNPLKLATLLLLVGTLGIAACNPLTESAGRPTRIVLAMGRLLAAQQAGDFLSVVDTARLTVTGGNGPRSQSLLVGPGESEAAFDVTVPSGSVRFTADVLSNSGVPVYRGDTTMTINGDFTLDLNVHPVNPVMVVSPGHVTFIITDNGQFRTVAATLRVRNPGVGTLMWRVDSTVARPAGVSFSCGVLPGEDDNCKTTLPWTAGRDAAIILRFGMPSSFSFLPSSLRFLSNVGSITFTP